MTILNIDPELDDKPLQVDPVLLAKMIDQVKAARGLPTGPGPAPRVSDLPQHPSSLGYDNMRADMAGGIDAPGNFARNLVASDRAAGGGLGGVDYAPQPPEALAAAVAKYNTDSGSSVGVKPTQLNSLGQTEIDNTPRPDVSPVEPRTFQPLAQFAPATERLDDPSPGPSTPAPTHLANDPYSGGGLPEAEKLSNQMLLSAQLQRAGQTIGSAFSRQTVKPNEAYLSQLTQLSSEPVRRYMEQRMMQRQGLQDAIALGRLGVSRDAEGERELHDKAMIDQAAQRFGETMRHNGVAEGQGQERVDLTKDKQFIEPGDVFAPGLRLDPSAPRQERGYIQKSILEPENGFQALRGVISKLGELHKQYGNQPLPTDAQAEMIPWVKQLIANERGLLGARYMTDADLRFLKDTVGDPTKWSQFFDDRVEPMLRSQYDVAVNQRKAAFQHVGVLDNTGTSQSPIGGSPPPNSPAKAPPPTGTKPQFKLSGGKWYKRGPGGEAIPATPDEVSANGLQL